MVGRLESVCIARIAVSLYCTIVKSLELPRCLEQCNENQYCTKRTVAFLYELVDPAPSLNEVLQVADEE